MHQTNTSGTEAVGTIYSVQFEIRLIDNSNNDDGKSILTKSNKDRSHILDIMDMSITFRMKGAR